MKQFEIEFKYSVKNLDEKEFATWIKKFKPEKVIHTDSDDIFYFCAGVDFIRLRDAGVWKELTVKKKTTANNNVVRLEGNVDLSNKCSTEDINIFLDILGCQELFTIKKKCAIYIFQNAVVALYSVYNEKGEIKGKFLEVEAERNHVESEEDAMKILLDWEKRFEEFNITHHNRIRKSLFELRKTGVI